VLPPPPPPVPIRGDRPCCFPLLCLSLSDCVFSCSTSSCNQVQPTLYSMLHDDFMLSYCHVVANNNMLFARKDMTATMKSFQGLLGPPEGA
jgi:hypothetical protein